MKVIHLSSERTWRGGEQQIAYLIEGSLRAGLQVHVACRTGSAFSTYCKNNDIPHIDLGYKNEFDLGTAFKIKDYCKEHLIDLVHMHSSHSHAIGVWSKILGNPADLILSRRVDFPIKDNLASRFKFNYPKIKAIVSISAKIQEIIAPDIKRQEILHTVHSGIAPSRFEHATNSGILHQAFGIDHNIKLVGNISAVADHKDYFTFIDTAEKVLAERKDVKFLIIGDGPLNAEIRDRINQSNFKDGIIMTGFRDDIPAIIQELDVFLITSKTEGLGTTILDAFANRVPVVATKAGGIPEAVIHQETGLLSNVGDSQSLADQVIQTLDDKEKTRQRITQAYDKLLREFTIDAMVKGNLEVYKNVLN